MEAKEEEEFNPFHFTELWKYCQNLILGTLLIFLLLSVIHFWLQLLVIFLMYQVLRASENCIESASQFLKKGEIIPLSTQTQMLVYGFGDIICSYICGHTLVKLNTEYHTFADAILSSALLSLSFFLIFSSTKHIGFSFRFFKITDIENGALGLLTITSIIFRYIAVTPIWMMFLGETNLSEFPSCFNGWHIAYILGKIVGFWLLCVDFSDGCTWFFRTLLKISPSGAICQRCKEKKAELSTQCNHHFCRACIERSRKANGECPVCRYKIPRKWTMPFKFGAIPMAILICVF